MKSYEQLLSKDEINRRFVMAIYAILDNKLISNKTRLAESLKVKPAKFSEILNFRMKVGIDMVATMCDSYMISPDWLLMSRGNNIFRQESSLPQICINKEDINRNIPSIQSFKEIEDQKSRVSEIMPLLGYIKEKDDIIQKQAGEIGTLRERVRQLEDHIKKTASDAANSRIASAG